MRTYFGGIIEACRVEALNAAPSAWPSVRFRGAEKVALDDVDWLNRPFILKVAEGFMGKEKLKLVLAQKDL